MSGWILLPLVFGRVGPTVQGLSWTLGQRVSCVSFWPNFDTKATGWGRSDCVHGLLYLIRWFSSLENHLLPPVLFEYDGDGTGRPHFSQKIHDGLNYRIPSYISNKEPCPFLGGISQTNPSNLILDTGYMDSHNHFGMNAPPDQRILVRRLIPLRTACYRGSHNRVSKRK
ncbi:hypothetical protein HD806DRAFT_521573 [Xylariaceae sp. AK1471]|nr:hypothetical protein HD806DRAFT_521573 [Xylariaceae sp. AK1471]